MIQEEFLRERLKALQGNFSKLARENGLDYRELKETLSPQAETSDIRIPSYPMPSDISTLSKHTSWKGFVIAAKSAGSYTWTERSPDAIGKARSQFDEGLTIMCQSKHPDGWFVLYSIPLQQRATNRRPFFSIDWSAK